MFLLNTNLIKNIIYNIRDIRSVIAENNFICLVNTEINNIVVSININIAGIVHNILLYILSFLPL